MGDEKQDERRFKSIVVDEATMLHIVRAKSDRRLRIDWGASGLPDDVKVHHVWHDPQRAGFVFILKHKSFDPVPPGMEIPSNDKQAMTTWEILGPPWMTRDELLACAPGSSAMVDDGDFVSHAFVIQDEDGSLSLNTVTKFKKVGSCG